MRKKKTKLDIAVADKNVAKSIQKTLFEDFEYGLQPKKVSKGFSGTYTVETADGFRVGVVFDSVFDHAFGEE